LRAEHQGAASLNRYEHTWEAYREETGGLGSLVAGASRLARLGIETPAELRPIVDVATGVAGPILAAYVLWVLNNAQREGISRLYFVARDGEILYLIAQRLCERLGLNVNVSAKTGESSIACAAATHIAAALPQIAWGLTLSNEGLSDDATARPIRIEHGHVEVSDRPGLGIDVDEDRVRRYQRDVPVRQVA